MRISDWSSDVCSSDLSLLPRPESDSRREAHGAKPTRNRACRACLGDRHHGLHWGRRNRLAPTNSSIRMAVPAARKALTPGRENARCPPYSDRRAHDRWPEARRRLRTADIRTVRPAGVGGMTYMSSERSEEHTSELKSLMRISYAVF